MALRSALFVDFDNVFTQLRQLQPDAAERFARHPADWIRWLVEALEIPDPHDEAAQRRLLVRRCYLNPNWYQSYRHSFLRAGFEIVDCPPVTSQGKTSTDIHMVLDIIELLQHETRYDEFIVFSADADFTPVLRKLRRHDRRTTVLAIGFPSAAYQASADLLIDERLFIQNALGFGADGDAVDAAAQEKLRAVDPRASLPRENAIPQNRAEPASARAATEPAEIVPRRQVADETLASIGDRILLTVEQSSVPVSAARLASRIRQEHPQITQDWNGLGTFKQFFRSLEIPRLVWAVGSGGRIYDPARHQIEVEAVPSEPRPGWIGDDATYRVARDVSYLTGAPLLAPSEVRIVLEFLADDLTQNPFELAATAQRVCDKFLERHGTAIDVRDVTFLMRGMQLNGHTFGEGGDDIETLAQRMFNQLLFLCEREQMVLDEAATERIRHWIGGDLLTPKPAV